MLVSNRVGCLYLLYKQKQNDSSVQVQDLKKKEKELQAKEAELKKREQVSLFAYSVAFLFTRIRYSYFDHTTCSTSTVYHATLVFNIVLNS